MNHDQEREKLAAERRQLEVEKLKLKRERDQFEKMKKEAHQERDGHRLKMMNANRGIRRGAEYATRTERLIHEEEQREQAILNREQEVDNDLQIKLDTIRYVDALRKQIEENEKKETKAQKKLERQAKAAEKKLRNMEKLKNELVTPQ